MNCMDYLDEWLNEVHGKSAQVSGTSFTESLIGLTPNGPCVSPVQLTSLPYLLSLLSLQCCVFLKTPRQSRYCKRNWQKMPTLGQTLTDVTPLSGMGLQFVPHAVFYGTSTSVIIGLTIQVCGDTVSDNMTCHLFPFLTHSHGGSTVSSIMEYILEHRRQELKKG